MAKTDRPDFADLAGLLDTSVPAAPMAGATQRGADMPRAKPAAAEVAAIPTRAKSEPPVAEPAAPEQGVKGAPATALEGLSFKVSPEFNTRFRDAAHKHKLKLNELLFEAFDVWAAKNDKGR